MNGRKREKLRASIPSKEHDPTELFAPIIGLLLRSGISEKELSTLFARAMGVAKKSRTGPQVYRVETKYLSGDLLHRWLRDPNYLNANGKPIDLPLRGEKSIASLISESLMTGSPENVVAFMLKFKNIRKTKSGSFRLLRRSLNFKIPEYLPFEPNYEFLVDAARACTRGIGYPGKSPEVFWQRADSLRLSQKQADSFLEFAETRGMLFVHEMNDWLDQHADNSAKPRRASIKVGIGYFGICRQL